MIGLTVPSLCYAIMAFVWFGLNEGAAILAIAGFRCASITINIWEGVNNRHQAGCDGAGIEATRPAIVRARNAADIPLRDGVGPLRARHHLEDHGAGGIDPGRPNGAGFGCSTGTSWPT